MPKSKALKQPKYTIGDKVIYNRKPFFISGILPQQLDKERTYLLEDINSAGFENFNITTNFSIIESEQNFSDDERDARLDNLRVGEELEDGRTLQGQSPFLLNFGLNYNGQNNGWQGGVFYNVQGRTLQIVGNGNIPDVFTLPFHSLNFNIGKTFGEKKNSSISLKFSNLLDDDIESVYESFGSEDRVYSRWSPGQEISLGYTYKF